MKQTVQPVLQNPGYGSSGGVQVMCCTALCPNPFCRLNALLGLHSIHREALCSPGIIRGCPLQCSRREALCIQAYAGVGKPERS